MTDLNLVVLEKTTELFLSVLTCVPRKMTAFFGGRFSSGWSHLAGADQFVKNILSFSSQTRFRVWLVVRFLFVASGVFFVCFWLCKLLAVLHICLFH